MMPHSISGIYSMYYANAYPDEVKAVIGIDFTLPQVLEYFGESAPTMSEYMKYVFTNWNCTIGIIYHS